MFEGMFKPMHLILILIIVMIIFGPGKVSQIGEVLGKSIKGFKKAMTEEENKPSTENEKAKTNG